ncbi:MAG: FliA/WhiG family RNA polymerase sigma factor, partial [Rhodothermaceae bacterium]|nr:FliA/WhiG family RNA polymerase sigma factor [Rhodothermaceae bacterium]
MANSSDLQHAVDQYLATPTPACRDAAVLAGLPLVHSLVGRLRAPNHPLVTPEDLEGTAIEALLQALDTYDPNRGAQFVTHAYRRVRGALVDYLRRLDVLSREKRQRINEVYRAMATLRQALGDEPTASQVADHLGMPL